MNRKPKESSFFKEETTPMEKQVESNITLFFSKNTQEGERKLADSKELAKDLWNS